MMELILLAVIIVLTAALWHRKPVWALATIFFLLPFERIGSLNVAGHTVRLIQVATTALIISFGVDCIIRRRKLRWSKSNWLLVAFVVSTFITSCLINSSRFWQNYVSMLLLLITFFVISQLITKRHLSTIRTSLFASALTVSLFGIYQFIGDMLGLSSHWTGIRDNYSHLVYGVTRVHSVASEPLYFASYLLIPLLLGLGLYLHKKAVLKGWEKISMISAIIAFGLSLSRGAFLVFALGGLVIVVVLLVIKQLSIKHLLISALTFLGLGLVALSFVIVAVNYHGPTSQIGSQNGQTFIHNFFNLHSVEKSTSYRDRQERIDRARVAWRHSKLFGLGLGRANNDASADLTPALAHIPGRYNYDATAIFNFYWELMAETGLIGFVLFVSWVGSLITIGIWRALHSKDFVVQLWLIATTVALLCVFIQAYSFTGFYLSFIWIELGLLAGLTQLSQQRSST